MRNSDEDREILAELDRALADDDDEYHGHEVELDDLEDESWFADEDIVDDVVECPACGDEQSAALSYLGTLGSQDHHRCLRCGWVFQVETNDEE